MSGYKKTKRNGIPIMGSVGSEGSTEPTPVRGKEADDAELDDDKN